MPIFTPHLFLQPKGSGVQTMAQGGEGKGRQGRFVGITIRN